MESGESSSSERHAVFIDSSCFRQFSNASNPWLARYVYGLLFLIATLLAWAARDYGRNALTEMERLKECKGGRDCLGAEGVLRVSLGCFSFFITMFLSTAGTSKLNGRRDSWHSGWWAAKIVMGLAFAIIPFLLPSAIIQFYGEIAHFGAGVFLLIQLISIISFIMWLNDCCQADKYAERCQIHMMLLATTAYIVCLVGIILMYIWYAPEPSCLLNIFFITWTLVLLQLMTSVSLHPKVNAGILTPGLMGLYVVFICWCAIRSEPAGDNCIRRQETTVKTDWLTIIVISRFFTTLFYQNTDDTGVSSFILFAWLSNIILTTAKSFVVAVLAIVIATFSTGIDSKCFQIRKDETQAEDDVPYGYGFFHFVFATGAMYFAMLLIGWNTHHAMRKWTIDVGWTSTWVRIVNEWLAVCVYLWMLVAPIIWKCRQTAEST